MLLRNITQVKAELSALVEQVIRGNEILIGKSGKPVAKIVPYIGGAKERVPGALKGKIIIHDDFDQLPDDIAESFGIVDSK